MSTSIRRASIAAILAALVLALAGGASASHHPRPPHPKTAKVKVMTRNVYLGADLAPAINASSTNEFVDANGQIVRDVITNDFPTRAQGLADEILTKKPDLVGLQEVAEWRKGPLNDTAPFSCTGDSADSNPPYDCAFTASTVRYDYLKELLAELNKGKTHYRIVESNQEFDFEAPADVNGTPGDGDACPVQCDGEENDRLTMRDVILAKVGKRVKTSNVQTGHYHTLYEPSVAGTVTVHVVRGWLSADVKVGDSPKFRFIDTHLESFGDPKIREAQAKELVKKGNAGDPKGKLPVVLVGDLNSDDDTVTGGDRLAYKALTSRGYSERSTGKPTGCCLRSSILTGGMGSRADFDHQVDHILTNDPKQVKLVNSSVTGLKPANGFWDSDHAGLFSTLSIAK